MEEVALNRDHTKQVLKPLCAAHLPTAVLDRNKRKGKTEGER
jgi:hypothetical protein